MRSKTQITKKRTECFYIALGKQQDENEEPERDYYCGAWYALRWVMGDEDDI